MQKLNVLNPATGEVIGHVDVTPVEQIPMVVDKAWKSLEDWRKLSVEERGKHLIDAGKVIVERANELGELLSKEMGKPLKHGIGEVKSCGTTMEEEVAKAKKALAPVVTKTDKVETTLYYDPIGVSAVISPWNFPISMPHWMIVPSLLAGNTVVIKPSEETPLIAQAYVDILNQFLPEGVLQIIHGESDQGKALVSSNVRQIVFTGSRAAGKHIMKSASDGLKRIILELGGKDPLILLDDADVDEAAKFAVMNSFSNSGQVCVSTERVFVHKDIASKFEEKVVEYAKDYKVGPYHEEGVKMGPMINDKQRTHVINHIKDAVDKGAKILMGSTDHPDHYVNPTILTDINEDMATATDETFGPLLCISKYESVENVIETMNKNPYALGAAVFGKDEERAYNIAHRLDAGMIGVNKGLGSVGDTPWVGAKESGYGYHGSPDGFRQFTQARVISKSLA